MNDDARRQPLQGRHALVIGFGVSGRAAARLLRRLGADVAACDDHAAVREEIVSSPGMVALTTAEAREKLGATDLVIPSPGVAVSHPLLAEAVACAVPVLSELELAARFLAVPLLAVSGTNGKSTTVSLLARMLEEDGRRVFLGGNIGNPLSDAVGGDFDCCVVEVSSFQLEWVDRLAPTLATILNLTPDHLDRHGDVETYTRTKLRLFSRMQAGDHAVFCRDQGWWRGRTAPLRARVTTFGASPLKGEEGIRYDEEARLVRASDGWTLHAGPWWPHSRYDFENLAAAAEIARLAGVCADVAERAVRAFDGLPHRLRPVGCHEGIEFWDDSKATNPGASLRSIEAMGRPVVLLAGGVAKGNDFTALGRVASRLRLVVAYGPAAADIAAALEGLVPIVRAERLAEAFGRAVGSAREGDAVLLAPACASFDEFSDYAERGRRFIELVEGLKR